MRANCSLHIPGYGILKFWSILWNISMHNITDIMQFSKPHLDPHQQRTRLSSLKTKCLLKNRLYLVSRPIQEINANYKCDLCMRKQHNTTHGPWNMTLSEIPPCLQSQRGTFLVLLLRLPQIAVYKHPKGLRTIPQSLLWYYRLQREKRTQAIKPRQLSGSINQLVTGNHLSVGVLLVKCYSYSSQPTPSFHYLFQFTQRCFLNVTRSSVL